MLAAVEVIVSIIARVLTMVGITAFAWQLESSGAGSKIASGVGNAVQGAGSAIQGAGSAAQAVGKSANDFGQYLPWLIGLVAAAVLASKL